MASLTRVLITGITGMIGSHLADYLLERGDVDVFAFKRWRSDDRTIDHLPPAVQLLEGDVEDYTSVASAISVARPSRIFHLAAQSYPRESWDAPQATFNANVNGTINVLEVVRQRFPETVVHVAGSSAQYGFVRPEDCPIRESQPQKPLSPYGVSKVAQELLAYQYHANYGIQTVITRSFNHAGTRQGERTSINTFCKQMAEIEAGLREPVIRVGNLTTRRDFLDVRDACRALWLLTEQGEWGEAYNLCSGRSPLMQEILDEVVRLGEVPVRVEVDPARLRPSDEPILQGSSEKLRAATGWQPEIPLEATIQWILDYWRDRLAPRSSSE